MNTLHLLSRWQSPAASERGLTTGSNQWFACRSVLTLSEGQMSMPLTAWLAADTKYDLYVNGQLVVREGGLKRGPTPGGTYIDQIDLRCQLQVGENSIAILLWYFGRHGFSHRDSGLPGFLFEIPGLEPSAWKVKRHPAYFDAGYVNQAYRLPENSVGYDARLALAGWTQPCFDDESWPLAEASARAGDGPWGQLVPNAIPAWRWSEVQPYTSVTMGAAKADGQRTLVCKLPYNTQFLPVIKVKAEEGIRVAVTVGQDTACICSTYITINGEQEHIFPGWINGEVAMYEVPSFVDVLSVGFIETGYPASFAGHFTSDDDVLNKLWLVARRTVYLNMRENFMDCPCRERAQWPGDMVIQQEQLPYCLDRTADLLAQKGFLETFRWQRDSGVIYGPVPEGNWRMELPAQMLSILSPHGLWGYYMNTADLDTIKEVYAGAKRYHAIWEFQPNGLIVYRPQNKGTLPVRVNGVEDGIWDWIDWGEKIDAEPALNAWFVLATMGLRNLAKTLGFDADAAAFEAREHSVRQSIRANFWDADRGGFASKDFEFLPDDRVQALMILCGAATKAEYPALLNLFETVYEACPYMERYVLEALFVMGQPHAALRRMRKRYLSMLKTGHSTLWERWPEGSEHPGTINHSWSGGPLTLLSNRVAGIRPIEPGWSKVLIQPCPGDLDFISASVLTGQGKIALCARLEQGQWDLDVEIPQGVVVELDTGLLSSKKERQTLKAGNVKLQIPGLSRT